MKVVIYAKNKNDKTEHKTAGKVMKYNSKY